MWSEWSNKLEVIGIVGEIGSVIRMVGEVGSVVEIVREIGSVVGMVGKNLEVWMIGEIGKMTREIVTVEDSGLLAMYAMCMNHGGSHIYKSKYGLVNNNLVAFLYFFCH